ncbi:MAG: hypothetical protein SGJ21_17040 [Alphaproteobacteria bacterium]|nr:hypothetical protein [Alphaproteobacteria bacterium]
MRIPVFVSRPSKLSDRQKYVATQIYGLLEEIDLEPRTIGQSDKPGDFPLREVLAVGRHCSGGLILGFDRDEAADAPTLKSFPTPWNHLEAGVLFSLGKPLLVWKDPDINGGIFDHGVTGTFVHQFKHPFSATDRDVRAVFSRWQAQVSALYHAVD